MYFHGIDLKFIYQQYPYLNPDAHLTEKTKETQVKDRLHLIERFGFEPVHLLESSREYPLLKCLRECFNFGNVVLAYRKLKEPVLQLSCHEIGVTFLDITQCSYIFVRSTRVKSKITQLCSDKPVILVKS